MLLDARISGEAPEYTSDCCVAEPFCDAHGSGEGARFYLVRVAAGGRCSVSAHCDGVRVRDSWGLGKLDSFSSVVLRMLLTAQIGQDATESSASSSAMSPSEGGSSSVEDESAAGVEDVHSGQGSAAAEFGPGVSYGTCDGSQRP
jgi:hypothetical protein